MVLGLLPSQNTDSSANRKIVRELKKTDSDTPKLLRTGCQHPERILLSESEEHFTNLVQAADKNSKIDNAWLESKAEVLYSILNEPDHHPKRHSK